MACLSVASHRFKSISDLLLVNYTKSVLHRFKATVSLRRNRWPNLVFGKHGVILAIVMLAFDIH